MTDFKDLPNNLFDFNKDDFIKTLPKRLPIKDSVKLYPHPEDASKVLVIIKEDNYEIAATCPLSFIDEQRTVEVKWELEQSYGYYWAQLVEHHDTLQPYFLFDDGDCRPEHPQRIHYKSFTFHKGDMTELIPTQQSGWYLDIFRRKIELEANLEEVNRALEEYHKKFPSGSIVEDDDPLI